ncbi:hypothetical protein ASPCAL01407 [Aspergillus calidoustus]|uniref:Uncharacterized protein n=1 Tax=Aspergillus calidoustus TaxID=454130 RepID=A0A0U4YXM4_ASPCI|nr:hypothetical protein ASPCAL01407 [Aspergillus calidoustus]
MTPLQRVPETIAAWNVAVEQRRLQGKTIHGEGLGRMDRKGERQIGGRHMLANHLGGLPKKQNPGGTFALVRHYQDEVCSRELEFKPNCLDTPVAMRTRSHTTSGLESQFRSLSVEDSPTRSRSTGLSTSLVPMTPLNQSSAYAPSYGTPGYGDEGTPSPLQILSPGPEELHHVMYPPTKDEQIVNTALVLLLNALAMYQNLNVSWTMHRIPLRAIFDPYSFEARTDGYLSDGQGNSQVLIEVKPVRREDKLAPIRMQESAQMVAWIKAYEDGVQGPRKMRFIISQVRHEIFITLAEYKTEYVNYLQGVSDASGNISLMAMHEYGPWDTRSAAHMYDLGLILLAISLQADAEVWR